MIRVLGRHFQGASLGLCFALGSGLFSLDLSGANDPLRWHWSNPRPHGNNIIDMAHQNGLGIQVCDRGQLYASSDPSVWIPLDSRTTNSLRGVTFFGQRIVATGENGTIVYADSLDDFQPVNLGTANWLEGVAASTNLLVAVGDNAAVYTSTNGADWDLRPQPFTTWLRDVAFASDQFVAVGEDGFIATSSDGITWRSHTSGTTSNLNFVKWIVDRFWTVGDGGTILTSPNGTAWQSESAGATNFLATASGASESRLVAGDFELRLRQSDLWQNELTSTSDPRPPVWTYLSSYWDGRLYLLGGRSGVIVEGFQTNGNPYLWVTRND